MLNKAERLLGELDVNLFDRDFEAAARTVRALSNELRRSQAMANTIAARARELIQLSRAKGYLRTALHNQGVEPSEALLPYRD